MSIFLGVKKYEKTWYNGRAVAESIKTSTWRYSMRATPFEDASRIQIPKSEFRSMLSNILKNNRELGESIGEHEDTGDQITSEMNRIRMLSTKERLDFYVEHRVDDQRLWYTKKAAYNKRMHKRWFIALIAAQFLALTSVLLRIAFPEWELWPTDVFVVIASFAIGWMQIKKFSELASAYSLTAQEIGIIRNQSEDIETESALSEYTNNAELAFSREHTQWAARQHT
ncbi:DUF4231 domain-containing protein [Shewanella psychrophila]|nr:DUF4231 domain-containing protein [Shewanella psychrophila]